MDLMMRRRAIMAYPYIQKQASGAIAHFEDAAAKNLRHCVVDIALVQAGSGTPSLENVRPISGHTGVAVTVSPTTSAQDGTAYAVTFPADIGTVYGGTVDVVTGVLTVTHKYFGLAVADMNNYEEYPGWKDITQIRECVPQGTATASATTALNIGTVIGVNTNNANNAIYLPRLTYSLTQSEWKQQYPDLTVQIVFPLLQPITYRLTPVQILALAGVNNIWSDAGNVGVTYLAPRVSFEAKNPMDGTAVSYRAIMRKYFLAHGAAAATPAQLTALCDSWYSMYRNGWDGYTEFPLPDTVEGSDTGSYGTKGGSNAGLVCEASTDTVAGRDDYAGLPQFAPTDCNWILDADGNILVTDIDGITSGFERDNPDKFVGVLQMSMYHYWYDTSNTYVHGLTDTHTEDYANILPYPEAVRLDGTFRPWVCHGKYMSKTVNGKMTCCAGNIPTAFTSHNALISLPDSIGAQYSGGTETDWSFLYIMTMIKYGAITLDGTIQGCVSNNLQYYAAVGETGVKRILLTATQAANIPVGSSVLIGVYNGSSADRGVASNFSITGKSGALVTAKETVTVGGTSYTAVYVDTPDVFDTVANGVSIAGSTILSSWHWRTGTNDTVLGNDGSIVNAKIGKYPAKLQGIEYAMGGYEVTADCIMRISDGVYEQYIAKRTAYQATSITANMVKSAFTTAQPVENSWEYIRRQGYDGNTGTFFPSDTGGTSGRFTRDGMYKNGTATASAATRESLRCGLLSRGVGGGGLSCLLGTAALSNGAWTGLSRLSPNGSRGEFSA